MKWWIKVAACCCRARFSYIEILSIIAMMAWLADGHFLIAACMWLLGLIVQLVADAITRTKRARELMADQNHLGGN